MKEFMLLFRGKYETMPQVDDPEKWQDWMGGIAAQNKWVAPGQRLNPEG